MANLHEYVLHSIFDYLAPHEWLQVSQVCKLWKEAASKQWRKITEIDYHFKLDITFNQYLEDNNTDRESLHLPVISGKTAEKIMRQAAPFVERFAVSPYDGPEKLYLFGQYLYSVRVSDGDATLKLVAEHATNLTEVVFSHPPKTELLKFFFNVNKVKKFTFEEDSFFYKECPTDRIEKMKIKLIDIRGFTPFKGHFPNLKKLDFQVGYVESNEVEPILSKILPYIPQVTSLRMSLTSCVEESMSVKSLLGVTKLPQLESFTFKLDYAWVEGNDSSSTFINTLVLGCPELRVLKLPKVDISEESFCTLLTLPRLETLVVDLTGFYSVELSQTLNLTEFSIKVDYANINMTSFCNTLDKMPKLEVLEFETNNDDSDSFESFSLQLICKVAIVADSQGKSLFVVRKSDKNHARIIIKKKNEDFFNMEILTLKLEIPSYGGNLFFKRVQTFVLKYLTNHIVTSCRCHLNNDDENGEGDDRRK